MLLEGITPSQSLLNEMATDVYQSHTDHNHKKMTILRSLERPENWPVAAKKVKNSAALGIRIFVESGLEESLIVKTTSCVTFYKSINKPSMAVASY